MNNKAILDLIKGLQLNISELQNNIEFIISVLHILESRIEKLEAKESK